MAGRVTDWVYRHDPELNALHKAVKVAFAVTVGLAIGTLIGNPGLSLFAAFGAIALLLFADFPGSQSARLGAYLILVPVGALLIMLGTVLSTNGVLAVVGMVVVGFVVLFAGLLSAASAAASRAALLTYVLPVTVPGPVSDILPRLAGWGLAALLAVPAAVFIWPPKDHDALRARAADACRAIADQLTARLSPVAAAGRSAAPRIAMLDDSRQPVPQPIPDGSATPDPDQAAAAAIAALRKQFRSTEFRPVGLTTGSRLLVQLVDRLEWLRSVVLRIPNDAHDDLPAWNRELVMSCAGVMTAAAHTMPVAGRRPSPQTRQQLGHALHDLERFRRRVIETLELVPVGSPGSNAMTGRPPDHGEQQDDGSSGPGLSPALVHELGYTTHLAGQVVADSAAADARPLLDRLLGRQHPDLVVRPLTAAQRIAVGAINRRSVWFQNSIRGALGLSFAVLLAEVTEVSHGFWVVLGTMSVLRSSALNTGSTALRAIGGTIAGFLIGAGIMFVVGTNPVALWTLLPIVVMIAAFVPAAVSFTAGQAAFTVLVLVLFNIIDPVGWTVGLVRIEDILLGSLAGLVTGLLLWPRGAAAQIRNALAESYRSCSAALLAATRQTTSVPSDELDGALHQALGRARAAAGRLDDALRQYQSERGSKSIPISELTIAFNTASRMRLAAEAIATMTPRRPPAPAARSTGREPLLPSSGDPPTTGSTMADAAPPGPSQPSSAPAAAPRTAVQTACGELTDSTLATERWFDRTADVLDGKQTAVDTPCLPYAEDRILTTLRSDSVELVDRDLLTWARTIWWAALYIDDVIRTQTRLVPAIGAILQQAGPADPDTAADRGAGPAERNGAAPAQPPAGSALLPPPTPSSSSSPSPSPPPPVPASPSLPAPAPPSPSSPPSPGRTDPGQR